MYLQVHCPACHTITPVPVRLAGRTLKCPQCKADLRDSVKLAYESRPPQPAGLGLTTWIIVAALVVAMIGFFVSQMGRSDKGLDDGVMQAEWRNFVGTGGLYSVKLPGTPMGIEESFPAPGGRIRYVWHTLNSHDYIFGMGVIALPESANIAGPVDELLDATVTRLLADMEATRVSDRRVTQQGHAGLEAVYRLAGQNRAGVLRLFLVGRSFVLLSVRGPGQDPAAPGIRAFLQSLDLRRESPAR
ncbi:MAG TPA: hypothetical protein PKD86_14300 [Gemmatales bacterium]|nr:hypothetical protein [Gemmatales bacterium]HMP60516.1 hypothetical protein [Gemmatales bacterium]